MDELRFNCLCKKPHKTLATKKTLPSGKVQVTGKRDDLIKSGAYPKKMGTAMVKVWLQHRAPSSVPLEVPVQEAWMTQLE